MIRIEEGNCLEVMRRLAAEGVWVDAIVTDPPYHLIAKANTFGPGQFEKQKGLKAPSKRGFMGKAWDGGDVAFNSVTWGTAASLLKPGGHLLAFGGTRTYGRLQWAIEGGGFEVRDMIAWLYGSGFPKSLDVSKQIDKRKDWAALDRFQGEIRKARKRRGMSQSACARAIGLIGPNEILGGGGYMWFETGRKVPTAAQYRALKAVLALGDDCDAAFEAAEREVIGEYPHDWMPGGFGDHRFSAHDHKITAPETDAAKEWQGWGTALKPAIEPICVARKCLTEPSVAANLLKHGTGALNVDGCRVETEGERFARPVNHTGLHEGWDRPWKHDPEALARERLKRDESERKAQQLGRWPANVVHDGSAEVEDAFAAFGESKSQSGGTRGSSQIWGSASGDQQRNGIDDTGTASRFFYTAKADKHDRWGSKHPTVKPIDLMRWLVRLVTPPGGTVLDPFAGSGTTGIAAMAEGFDCILIEREEEYLADIRERLAFYEGDGRHSLAAKNRKRDRPAEELPLFAPPDI